MPLVNVMVNNRAYTIACDDGEEDHLRALAATVDAKTREVLSSVGQVGDTRLLFPGMKADARTRYRNLFTGESHSLSPSKDGPAILVSDLFATLPVAVLLASD